ncbi:MAG: fructose-6-phosphate aldolase [Dehalococcoidia bacterium]
MELFLDTANIEEIRQGVRLGVLRGVTTNPTLASREGIGDLRDYRHAVQEIAQLVEGPISVEVVAEDVGEMLTQGRDIAQWAPNVWVKLPSTSAGLEAMQVLAREGIRINQTLCFSVNQALLGAWAGATVVSPFVGRLDDAGQEGMQVVADIVTVFRRYQFPTKVMAASIRHPLHVVAAAKAGADIATVPLKVLMQMTQHPLTDAGVASFTRDWQRAVKV